MRVVYLGIGHWHVPWHLETLRDYGARVVAVWDADAALAARRAAELDCPAYADYRDALAAPADVVMLAARPRLAPDLLRAIIDAGRPALVEKSLGVSAADVAPLAELAARRGAYVSVLFANRMSPVWTLLGEAAGSELTTAHFKINSGTIQRYAENGNPWMLDRDETGGGCLRALGAHGADAVCQLAGDAEIVVEAASTANWRRDTRQESYGIALLRIGAHATAIVEAGYNQPYPASSDQQWRISTQSRYLDDQTDRVFVGEPAGERWLPGLSTQARYAAFVRRSLDNLRAGQPPPADLRDCERATRLIDRIYAAADR